MSKGLIKRDRGLLDTSVVIDIDRIETERLPIGMSISTLTLAELATGPHAVSDEVKRSKRQDDLQRAEAAFSSIPFDERAARAYGRIYAVVARAGRKARGRRAIDLMIAATALANELPLYTCNPADFDGLEELVEIIALS